MIPRAARVLGASMRLTRLIVADDLPGEWWIKEPLRERARAHYARHRAEPSWWRYTAGLDCPFCVGLWITGAVVAADHALEHRPWWRVLTTALAVNEAGAHLAVRLGDTPTDTDEEEVQE